MNKIKKWIRFNIWPFSSLFLIKSARKGLYLKPKCFIGKINTFTAEKNGKYWEVYVKIYMPKDHKKPWSLGWTCGDVIIDIDGKIVTHDIFRADKCLEGTDPVDEAEALLKCLNKQ